MISTEAFIAANRFGLGPRPGELQLIDKSPRDWLKNQITSNSVTPPLLQGLPPASEIAQTYLQNRRNKNKDMKKEFRQAQRRAYQDNIYARALSATQTNTPFAERLVQFWSNHFTVSSAGRKIVGPMSVAYETNAIRPHIFGTFEDMLLSVTQHPAMLMYLDNHISMGANSKTALKPRGGKGRGQKRGLNENLAREILELHTLGVNAGYTQNDVTEFAKIITGWSVGGVNTKNMQPNGFHFKRWMHEPGPKTFMGRPYENMGIAEGIDAMRFLAQHPSTANFIATKLVRHFVSDTPPQSAIKKIERVFINTKGNLAKISEALIDLPEIWQAPFGKTKRPYELMISVYRAFDNAGFDKKKFIKTANELRQFPFKAASPAGWSDQAEDWLTPQTLMRRVEWTRAIAAKLPRSLNPSELFDQTIAPVASKQTSFWVKAAPSSEEAIALILASPEFQRR